MTKPKAPSGFVLTKIPGYYCNRDGFAVKKGDANLMPDGAIGVAWFNETEPFVPSVGDDGTQGYSPNVQVLPIQDGWVPPVYTLHSKEEAP